jgi:hypothetical protein
MSVSHSKLIVAISFSGLSYVRVSPIPGAHFRRYLADRAELASRGALSGVCPATLTRGKTHAPRRAVDRSAAWSLFNSTGPHRDYPMAGYDIPYFRGSLRHENVGTGPCYCLCART